MNYPPPSWNPDWTDEDWEQYVRDHKRLQQGEFDTNDQPVSSTRNHRGLIAALTASTLVMSLVAAVLGVSMLISNNNDDDSDDPETIASPEISSPESNNPGYKAEDVNLGGGDQFYVDYEGPDTDNPCTITAVGISYSGKFALTSGSCVPVTDRQVATRNNKIGTVSLSETDIDRSRDTWDPSVDRGHDVGVISLPNAVQLRPSEYSHIGHPGTHMSVCMNGSVTGRQCGEVVELGMDIILVKGIKPKSGDIGAPLESDDGRVLYGSLSEIPNQKMDYSMFVSMNSTMGLLEDQADINRESIK